MNESTRIAELLKQAMGLDASTVGRSAIDQATRSRMAATGTLNVARYVALLESSRSELDELVEAVVVPETWFFRDPAAFEALAEIAVNRSQSAQRVLRILSVPCSTGEEPYSIAMTLLEAGLAPETFRIDGADISERALASARQGIYRGNSFRGSDLRFRDRHFDQTAERYQLAPTVRNCVRFLQENLLASDRFANAGCYDVIFFRNLLIYFDGPTQERALAKVNRLLAADGTLFVSPAEAFLVRTHGFESRRHPHAFAYRKSSRSADEMPGRITSGALARSILPSRQAAPKAIRVAAQRTTNEPPPDLSHAKQLADCGRLAEAARSCEIYLQHHGNSAAAYYLMGLVRDAMGDPDAAAICYRKTLYLEHHHVEALLHLALLAESRGDVATCQRLRQRAKRAEELASRS